MGAALAVTGGVSAYDPFAYAERRAHAREVTLRRGRVLAPDSVLGCACLIRDVSEGGARVELASGWTPRDRLVLIDLVAGRGYEGSVVWRRKQEIGLSLRAGYDLRGLTPHSLRWAKAAFASMTPSGGSAVPAFGRAGGARA